VDTRVVLVTLAYVSGLGIPLFFFSLAGTRIFTGMRKLNKFTGIVQQVFGLIMIVAALLIYTNYDKAIQVRILNAFPAYGNFLNGIEHNEKVSKELGVLRGDKEPVKTVAQSGTHLPDLGAAADFTGIDHWLNSGPLTMEQLRGKVVLVDFWTYSCINCVRTLPHVTGWYEKYKDSGFVVVGVHTPEFAFEKETGNVQAALKQFKINYPVAQDNNFGTWRAYANHYWPAKYLIDAQGHIRYTHFGEGKYEETETAIRELLREARQSVAQPANSLSDIMPRIHRTPETYLGSARLERFASAEKIAGGVQTFSLTSELPVDHFAYEGQWDVSRESATGGAGSALSMQFQGDKVFLVIGGKTKGTIKVSLDGQEVDAAAAGSDVKASRITIDRERLYHIIDFKGRPGVHMLRLECEGGDITFYAFTFG